MNGGPYADHAHTLPSFEDGVAFPHAEEQGPIRVSFAFLSEPYMFSSRSRMRKLSRDLLRNACDVVERHETSRQPSWKICGVMLSRTGA